MEPLKLEFIDLREGTQVRVKLNEETVTEYAASFLDGAAFPPVDVFYDGTIYRLADGFHRVLAAERAGLKDILATVHKGSRADCLRFALHANSAHGLPRSNADKRKAVELALKEFKDLSDRLIAKLVCVSHTYVSEIRAETLPPKSKKSAPKAKLPPPTRKAKADDGDGPNVVDMCLKDKVGRIIPIVLREQWLAAASCKLVADSIAAAANQITKARDDKNPNYAHVPQSVVTQLDGALMELKQSLPYVVCPTCQGMHTKGCRMCKESGFIGKFAWERTVSEEQKRVITRGLKA